MTVDNLQAEVQRLRAELAEEREERKRMGRALEDAMAAVRAAADDRKAIEERRASDRARKNASRMRRLEALTVSRDRGDAMSRDRHVTSPPPLLEGSPPSPDPLSPSPISSPPSLFSPPSSAASRGALELEGVAPKPAKKAKEAKKHTDPRHAPLTQELCETLGWPHHGGRTAKAVADLLRLAEHGGSDHAHAPLEVLRRAHIAREQDGFPRVRELHELVTHWGHFAEPRRRGAGPPGGLAPAPPDACAGCGARGQGGSVGDPEIWLGYECGCLPAFADAQSKGLHFTKAASWAAQRRVA